MPRWVWFAPLTLLVFAGAVWAFRWGWIAATITETDVINRYAQRYLREAGAGARLTDCTAMPGAQAGIWIVVRCAGAAGRYDYPVDGLGRLVVVPLPERASDAPQT